MQNIDIGKTTDKSYAKTEQSSICCNSRSTKKNEKATHRERFSSNFGDAHLASPMCKTMGANEDWAARQSHILNSNKRLPCSLYMLDQ